MGNFRIGNSPNICFTANASAFKCVTNSGMYFWVISSSFLILHFFQTCLARKRNIKNSHMHLGENIALSNDCIFVYLQTNSNVVTFRLLFLNRENLQKRNIFEKQLVALQQQYSLNHYEYKSYIDKAKFLKEPCISHFVKLSYICYKLF